LKCRNAGILSKLIVDERFALISIMAKKVFTSREMTDILVFRPYDMA
jgi:hypothetical protein